METLAEVIAKARAAGLTYGEFVALTYMQGHPTPQKPPKAKRKRVRHFTDKDAFGLWQQGKSDAEIGRTLGVSRALIQRWRDTLEIPSNSKPTVVTSNYHLIETSYGTFVITQ